MLATVSRSVAMKNQVGHQFMPGVGFIPHSAAPEIPDTAKGGKNCLPAVDVADGSVHIMKPSHGAPEMRLRWIASQQAWASLKPDAGNRLAWTAEHLSKAGWEYVGADQETEGSTRRKKR